MSTYEVKLAMGNFISGFNAKEYRIGIDRITRARKHINEPMIYYLNKLLSPPLEFVSDYVRFNEISESVFYY